MAAKRVTRKPAETAPKKRAARKKSAVGENELKWGTPTHEMGWSYVPNLLLEHQAELELKPIHLNIILTIMRHWWQRDSLPWPSVSSVAKTIGRSRSLVQRRIAEMEDKGYIRRIGRRDAKNHKVSLSNEYDFAGLVAVIDRIAKQRQKDKRTASAVRSK